MSLSELIKITEEPSSTRDAQMNWLGVVQDLREEYGDDTYKSWISKLDFVGIEGNAAAFKVPTHFIKDWIITHFEKKILRAWQKKDPAIGKLYLTVDKNGNSQGKHLNAQPVHSVTNGSGTTCPLDKRFTFEDFVVGPPNEFAYTAARAIADTKQPRTGSNPLFLYGGVGLGKTHLMHAIAWKVQDTTPSRKVVYTSAEKFMYQFVTALRNKDIINFKENFRSVDVLMVDDVQFMCGKDSTQEEFFHTLNALIDHNKQIIISADRSPSDLENMEERIKSRLGWGLVADIHSTTYELRLGILQSKLVPLNAHISLDVLEFLARKITSNVRELEGALNKVLAYKQITGQDITLDNIREILSDLLRSNEKVITIEDIQRKIAEKYNIKFSDMYSGRRLRAISRPRQIAMYIAKLLTSKSLSEIGRKFGGKDHTTVIHAVKAVEILIERDREFAEDVRLLIKVIEC